MSTLGAQCGRRC